MKRFPLIFRKGKRGFSLVEMMTAVAIFSLVMVLVFQMLERTTATWKTSKDSVSEYKDARNAFEAITRRLSQASLNTYWKIRTVNTTDGSLSVAQQYQRMAELHYVSGPAREVIGNDGAPNGAGARVGHCLFFQAPTGISYAKENETKYRFSAFQNLLNSWGYFVEFNTDFGDRPSFLNNIANKPATRARFRLMEYMAPAETNFVYQDGSKILQFIENSPDGKMTKSETYNWFKSNRSSGINFAGNYPTGTAGDSNLELKSTRVVADNVLALIVLPTDTADPNRKGRVSPNYIYDTRAWLNNSQSDPTAQAKSRNQLPPIVEVLMIALDESAVKRMNASLSIKNPDDYQKYPFWGKFNTLFKNPQLLERDLAELRQTLAIPTGSPKLPITFRVFRSTVRIRESGWGGVDTVDEPS